MIFRKSITAKFLAALFLLLLVGQSLGAVMLIMHNRSALFESLEKRIKTTAAIAAGVTAGPLLSYDFSLIDTYLEEVTRDEDISSVHILDGTGKLVREKIKKYDGDYGTLNPFMFKKTMTIKVPVMTAGSKIGEVKVDYSAHSVNEEISRAIFGISLSQFTLLLFVGVVMTFLFSKDIKKPVSRINSAVDKISLGDLTTTMPDLGENEIGSIAKGITFLVEKLSQTVAKMNSTAVNVSSAIRQVDATYKSATGSITRQTEAISDVVSMIQSAKKDQAEINDSTEKLSSLSIENVSSLIELKATAEEITTNTQRLFKATEDSYSVVAEMTQTAKSISKTSADALVAVEDTSASIEEIGASVREVEEHARESSKIAENVKEITSSMGMMSVVNAVEGMDNISERVSKSAEIVERLGARSSDIEKVLSVIKDVTEQTNLLSLNAAILAAQAGEYGKSFSVVADEISALSERTANSTREIGGIVKAIQRDIRDAIHSIESTREKVDSGNALVLKVGEALRETLNASVHSFEMTKAIERATQEQSLGLKQVSTAIEDLKKMMHGIAKSTGEQENALSYLLEGVGEVKEVADLSKRGTEEQAIGTKGISKNLEYANDRITTINQAILNQQKKHDVLVGSMDKINDIGLTTLRDMGAVSQSLSKLFEEVAALKKEMEVFKVRQNG